MKLGVVELYLLLAAVAGHFEMNIFQTDRADVELLRDWYGPRGKLGSERSESHYDWNW